MLFRSRVLEAFHEFLEEQIRANPEQYFWLHRRWKTLPPGVAFAPGMAQYPEHAARAWPPPPPAM